AFAHEAGIHQDGKLKERNTHEIMNPEDIRLAKTAQALGKHTGRHSLRQKDRDLGHHPAENPPLTVFESVKPPADPKKEIYDADIEALAESQIHDGPALWTLENFHVGAGTGSLPMAAVTLVHTDGRKITDAACGDGPIDAIFTAIERIAGVSVKL